MPFFCEHLKCSIKITLTCTKSKYLLTLVFDHSWEVGSGYLGTFIPCYITLMSPVGPIQKVGPAGGADLLFSPSFQWSLSVCFTKWLCYCTCTWYCYSLYSIIKYKHDQEMQAHGSTHTCTLNCSLCASCALDWAQTIAHRHQSENV